MAEGALLADANVLIDYAKAGPHVPALASAHLGGLHVVSVVLHAEVRQLSERRCRRLGIEVLEPTFDQLAEAGSGRRVLSFHDWCCLIVARDRGHALVTNDKALRKACTGAAIDTKWGLELLLDSVRGGHLGAMRARRMAIRIQELDPTRINAAIMARFRARLGD
jgi:hypothetical protein